jgi:NADH:ubiquinone oxidoreductase subunit 6 (subunit J)
MTKLPSDIIGQKASRRTGVGLEVAMADCVARCYVAAMASFLSTILLPVAVGAVALVLLLGLLNMMRDGSPNRSQKLMRLRVLLQFVAIVITMLTVWAMGR